MTDKRIWKDTKSTITCLKNRIGTGAGFPFVCTCGSNTTFKFHIETRKIERGIALIIMPLVLITTCLMYRNRFWVISLEWWRTGQCNRCRSSPCVFRTAVYTKFHLNREEWFFLTVTDFRWKVSPKIRWFWVFLDISTRSSRIRKLFGPAYAPLCHGQCFQFSSPNLQWSTSFDFRKLYPLYGWPSSCDTPSTGRASYEYAHAYERRNNKQPH